MVPNEYLIAYFNQLLRSSATNSSPYQIPPHSSYVERNRLRPAANSSFSGASSSMPSKNYNWVSDSERSLALISISHFSNLKRHNITSMERERLYTSQQLFQLRVMLMLALQDFHREFQYLPKTLIHSHRNKMYQQRRDQSRLANTLRLAFETLLLPHTCRPLNPIRDLRHR